MFAFFQSVTMRDRKAWLTSALGFGHFLPGFLVGVVVGLMVDMHPGNKGGMNKAGAKQQFGNGGEMKNKKLAPAPAEVRGGIKRGSKAAAAGRPSSPSAVLTQGQGLGGGGGPGGGGELKMVLVVRLDLKMGSGKIASQCAHAAVGTFEECLNRGQRYLLKRWEDCGQPKIVVTCNSQNEMNELRAKAERISLPVFTVADAGRTQVAAGSHTVLAIGPGVKQSVDSITRNLKLLG